jgi:hypothetical protein
MIFREIDDLGISDLVFPMPMVWWAKLLGDKDLRLGIVMGKYHDDARAVLFKDAIAFPDV